MCSSVTFNLLLSPPDGDDTRATTINMEYLDWLPFCFEVGVVVTGMRNNVVMSSISASVRHTGDRYNCWHLIDGGSLFNSFAVKEEREGSVLVSETIMGMN